LPGEVLKAFKAPLHPPLTEVIEIKDEVIEIEDSPEDKEESEKIEIIQQILH
jgi:hypothetical protein